MSNGWVRETRAAPKTRSSLGAQMARHRWEPLELRSGFAGSLPAELARSIYIKLLSSLPLRLRSDSSGSKPTRHAPPQSGRKVTSKQVHFISVAPPLVISNDSRVKARHISRTREMPAECQRKSETSPMLWLIARNV